MLDLQMSFSSDSPLQLKRCLDDDHFQAKQTLHYFIEY